MDALPEDSMSEIPPKLKFWNCVFGMLVHPKKTIRRIINEDIYYGLGWLCLIEVALYWMLYLTKDWYNSSFIVICIFIQTLVLLISTGVTWFIAKLFKGKALFIEMFVARFWSKVPLNLARIIVFIAFPHSNHLHPELAESIVMALSMLYLMALEILTYSEIQYFDVIKSILNLIPAFLIQLIIFAVPLFIILYILSSAIAGHSHGASY